MTLATGSRLGPYEILSALGAGGMGEVYRARDTKLGRDVALKILPAAFANDPERLARFQREAHVLASLNHSHIASIYGLEESGGLTALVLELVEGPTLADRIAQGPIPLDETLPIARQIAEALEAAHEQGIIHRDLKPANIKVRPDGTVKVLDFGLAKALEPTHDGGPSASLANSPTITSPAMMTGVGVILGTAAYMSPEQAKGRPADRRSDVWAFGCVLYEMLSGRRAFSGEDVSETLAAVLMKEPDWTALPATGPPGVVSVLRRCLQKDRKQRLRDIGDASLALEGAFEVTAPQATRPAPLSRSTRLAWVLATAATLAAAALTIPTMRHLREAPPEVRAVSTTLLPPDNADFNFVGAGFPVPALSPDGSRMVFGAAKDGKFQLWLRRLDSPVAQPLPGTEGATAPFWSPDSRWVGFSQATTLKKIDTQGGPPVVVTDLSGSVRGGSWSPQGVIVLSLRDPGPIWRVPASGGTATPTTFGDKGSKGLEHRHPWFLPDGRHFLYVQVQAGDLPVLVGSLDDSGTPGKVVAQAHSGVAFAQGHLLFVRDNVLMAQAFDANRLETTGEAVPVAEPVPVLGNPSRFPGFTVSSNGVLAYMTGSERQSRLVWRDRQGNKLGNLGELTGFIGGLALSPDSGRVAASIFSRLGEDIWIYDVAQGIPTRFTFGAARSRTPVWSPDGNTLYYSSDRNGRRDLFRKAANGTGTEDLLFADSDDKAIESVSPDTHWLLYTRVTGGTLGDLWMLALSQAPDVRKPQPHAFLATPFAERDVQFSSDGHWVAYSSTESGQLEVYASPFPSLGGKRLISSGGGIWARWRTDGKEIFYVTPDGQLMAAEVAIRGETMEVRRRQKLFDGVVTNRDAPYDVSANGQRFIVMEDVSNARPLTLLQNWTASLRK